MVAFKTRCYPKARQKRVLVKMVGVSRFLYNKAVEMIRDKVSPFSSIGEYKEAMDRVRESHVEKEAKRREAHLKKEEKRRAEWEARVAEFRAEGEGCNEGSKKRKRAQPKPFAEKVFKPKDFEPPRCPWLNKIWMRNYLASGTGALHQEHPWLNDVPKHTKEAAVLEAIEATSAAISNLRNGNIRHFALRFRSKKDAGWSLSLASNAASGRHFFRRKYKEFGKLKMAEERGVRDSYKHEITLTRDKYGRYWVVTRDKIPAPTGENQAPRERRVVMSIDPGQRTRHAIYSTDGSCYKFGDRDSHKLMGLCVEVDRCVSLLARKHYILNGRDFRYFDYTQDRAFLFRDDTARKKVPGSHKVPLVHKEMRALRRKLQKLRARIDNLKKEIDDQTVNFLCKNADAVLIPDFDSHKVAKKLRTKTARSLMNWRHGAFRSTLRERGLRRGLEVMVVSEHYTSMTCGACGHLKRNLGGAKMYRCVECGLEVDRDFNGARNIFLRAIRQS